jgi:hypothetical protein
VKRKKGTEVPSLREGGGFETEDRRAHSQRREFIPIPNALEEHTSRRKFLKGLVHPQHSSDPGPFELELQVSSSIPGVSGIPSQRSSLLSRTGSAITIDHPTGSPIRSTGTGSARSRTGTPQVGRTLAPLNEAASRDSGGHPTGGSPRTQVGRSQRGTHQASSTASLLRRGASRCSQS